MKMFGGGDNPRQGWMNRSPLNGQGRAALSGQTLKAMGYTNVAYMAPGFNGWTEEDLPIVIPEP